MEKVDIVFVFPWNLRHKTAQAIIIPILSHNFCACKASEAINKWITTCTSCKVKLKSLAGSLDYQTKKIKNERHKSCRSLHFHVQYFANTHKIKQIFSGSINLVTLSHSIVQTQQTFLSIWNEIEKVFIA